MPYMLPLNRIPISKCQAKTHPPKLPNFVGCALVVFPEHILSLFHPQMAVLPVSMWVRYLGRVKSPGAIRVCEGSFGVFGKVGEEDLSFRGFGESCFWIECSSFQLFPSDSLCPTSEH